LPQVPKRAERAAHQLLDAAGVTRPPVPVDELVTAEGIRLAFDSLGGNDVSGMLYRRGTTTVMVINEQHHRHRQRFTIAHEIGHHRLHEADAYLDGTATLRFRDGASATGTDREEREANAFAAALLMPADWVRDHFMDMVRARRAVDEDTVVTRLARQFDVSEQAMRFRLVNLGLMDPT
jgi:Zn-dependent peptidase ImmA (M78 family)